MSAFAVVLAAAAAAALAATWLARRVAWSLGVVAAPNPIIPQHTRPVAYLGGLGVAAGLAVGLEVARRTGGPTPSPGLLGGAVAFLLLGFVDDLVSFRPPTKLALQAAAALGAVLGGVVAPICGVPLLDGVLAWVWILAVVNAVNFTDVCDGLAAGLAVVAVLVVGLVEPSAGLVAAATVGAALGLLPFNVAPASIYLGDAGAHLLGFLWAALALGLAGEHGAWPGVAVAMLVVGVPLFELVFITVVQLRKGLPWWRGSPDHFALRLQERGLSKMQTCAVAWFAAALLAGCAVAIPAAGVAAQGAMVVGCVAGLAVAWRLLLRWEVGVGGAR
jgi:UDP-GlcNAc:undecaprenyl-phosphate/decaprenyl-phosphate GlcNAc-1-phosphate transferase